MSGITLRINKRWTALFIFLFSLIPAEIIYNLNCSCFFSKIPVLNPIERCQHILKWENAFDSALLLSPSSLRDFKPFLSQAASYTELFWNVNNFLCKYELLSTRATIRTSHLSFTETCLLSPVSHVPLHVCFLVGAALFYGSFCFGIHVATWHLCSSAVKESG